MTEPAPIPTGHPTPLDPPPELAEMRAHAPVAPMRFPDGHHGWLVTGHAVARQVLADPRFSSDNALRRPVIPLPIADENGLRPMVPGAFVAMDPPEHQRFRRPLAGLFTARRMRALEPRVRQIVQHRLDAMHRAGPPADLAAIWAAPVASLVMCELLGVPHTEQQRFERDAETLVRLEASAAEADAARQSLLDFLTALVRQKRRSGAGDVLGALAAAGEMTDEEVAGAGFLLLVAGYEITANMLAMGVLTLLTDTGQLARLRATPAMMPTAVEELLRFASVVQFGTVRGAREDLDLAGVRIKAGDSVCVSLPAANRDPGKFTDPDVLDLGRDAGGHLAFGHGVHLCLGQHLARIEMRVGYAALLQRFPGLRLAVEPAEVRMRTDTIVYGVHELPVTW